MISLQRTLDRQYSNCFSLGWFCGTASSLGKLGLRGHSGPFDWYFSDYSGVLKQIETGFTDFMNMENLEVDPQNEKAFKDLKYGFYCNHDVKNTFYKEYSDIKEKYRRRAVFFKKALVEPTVFFRTVRDQEEVEFINHNWKYARNLLKSFNSQNRIIYVIRTGLDGLTNEVDFYRLRVERYIGKTYEMRHMFDSCPELLELCTHLIDVKRMESNIEYDNSVNSQKATAAYVNKAVEEDIDGIDSCILEGLQIEAGEGIYIWGAGKFGIPLAKYLRNRNVVIKGIIDNKLHGERVEDFDIISLDDVKNEAKIFIAVSNKDANSSISNQIKESGKTITAIQYADLYEEDFDI